MDWLRPYGELDVLYFYSKVAPSLRNFLKAKSLATKTWLPKANIRSFIRRASKDGELFIEDLIGLKEEFFKIRARGKLEKYKDTLSERERLVWHYFVPRKYVEFFYSINGESRGLELERVYFDIDRRGNPITDAQKVAVTLIDKIKNMAFFSGLIERIIPLWTGNSFHIVVIFSKKVSHTFYERHLSLKSPSFLTLVDEINKETGFEVCAGHEKIEGKIVIDASQSVSGKLARAPFSIHLKEGKSVDGFCVPLSLEELREKNLAVSLEKINPEIILARLGHYEKLLA